MSTNFADILQEIKKIKTAVSVWSPSQKSNVELKALSLAQQKTIIESSVDTNLSVLFFNTTFTKILEQNLPNPLKTYDTVDRVNFALAMRSQIKDMVQVEDKWHSIKDLMDLNKSLAASYPTEAVIESTQFKIWVKNPSLEHDNKVNSVLLRKYKDDVLRGNKLKALISDLFVYEIYKFIDKIEIQSSGSQFDISSNLSGIELIDSMDSKEFVRVVEYINNLRDVERSFTKLPGTNTHIDIVPDFFVV